MCVCVYNVSYVIFLFFFFFTANRPTQSENTNAQLENMIAALRASFRTFFSEKEEHENSKKILGILLDTIRQLTHEINFQETNSDEVGIFFTINNHLVN